MPCWDLRFCWVMQRLLPSGGLSPLGDFSTPEEETPYTFCREDMDACLWEVFAWYTVDTFWGGSGLSAWKDICWKTPAVCLSCLVLSLLCENLEDFPGLFSWRHGCVWVWNILQSLLGVTAFCSAIL